MRIPKNIRQKFISHLAAIDEFADRLEGGYTNDRASEIASLIRNEIDEIIQLMDITEEFEEFR